MSLDHVLIIGAKLRAARLQQKLSLRDLAARAEVSPSLLSQIENGKTNPSVLTLHSVATALDVPITYFFPNPEENSTQQVVLMRSEKPVGKVHSDKQGGFDAQVLVHHSPVLHPSARVAIELMGGVRWERLTPADEENIQFLEIHYPPGATSGLAKSHHSGREFGLVLAGELKLEIGFESYTLTAGDSVIFDSSLPHRLINEGADAVRAVWVDMKPSG